MGSTALRAGGAVRPIPAAVAHPLPRVRVRFPTGPRPNRGKSCKDQPKLNRASAEPKDSTAGVSVPSPYECLTQTAIKHTAPLEEKL